MMIEHSTIDRCPSRGFFMRAMAICLALILIGCRAAGPNGIAPDSSQIESQIERLGRYVAMQDGLQFGWPGSGVALTFEGRWLEVEITDGGAGIMDIYIDGVEQAPLLLKSGQHRYRLIERAERAPAYVTMTRRTEVFDTGLFTITDIKTDGRIVKTSPVNAAKILFIGDSITAGFGVRGQTKDCDYSPATNHPRGAFAAMTAEALDADYQLIAISGRGVVHNWDGNPAPVMPAQIDYALPDAVDGPRWDHRQFMPDVVVTTLGTNDWSVIDPGKERFAQGYSMMLADIRARYPNAHIVTAGGPLLEGEKGAAIRDGIDGAMRELSDDNISTMDFTLSPTAITWSCNSHPGASSMERMARELIVHIAEQMDWPVPLDRLPPIAPPDALPGDGKAHFMQRVAQIDRAPLQRGGVMMVGDSISEGWLSQPKDLLGVEVTNHGVGWDSTKGALARLPQMKRHNPQAIFIMMGTNDISWGVEQDEIYSNMAALIEQLSAAFPEAEIYLQSILPRELDKVDVIKQINARYAAIANDAGVNYLDLSGRFSVNNGTLNPALSEDGLHLNRAGYRLWAEAIKPYVDE